MAYDAPGTYPEQNGHTRSANAMATPLALARVLEVQDGRARIRAGGADAWAAIDDSVDPALVARAHETGARVVVELGSEPLLVGVLMTARVPEIDRKGNLEVRVARFALHAEEALLQTPRAFLRLRREAAELFADELVARGRLLTRILGKAIKLN